MHSDNQNIIFQDNFIEEIFYFSKWKYLILNQNVETNVHVKSWNSFLSDLT